MKYETLPAVALLLDSSRGVYIPKAFAESFNMNDWHVSDNQRDCLLAGPDDEQDLYWDYWSSILDNAYYEKDGKRWTLYQDGDLWALCDADMTNDEKRNFGFDVDPFEYVIDLDERGEFKATVYDDKGNQVFEINGFDLFDDGYMKHKDDIDGLKAYLVGLCIMQDGDKLITG
jgi:hypothetical protein